jgi:hypothetical protein
MIKDELEYRVSQEWVIKFKQSIAAIDNSFESKINDYERWQLNRSALQCHLDKLLQEIAEYEKLINCDTSQPIQIKVNSLNELPFALIKARIAAKISLDELASRLGIDIERVDEYEKTNYQCASFAEILEVSTVLGVEFESGMVRVDFEEIENVKQTILNWDRKGVNVTTTT